MQNLKDLFFLQVVLFMGMEKVFNENLNKFIGRITQKKVNIEKKLIKLRSKTLINNFYIFNSFRNFN